MSIHVAWDNDAHTVIRITSSGQWTWDEYHYSVDETFHLIEQVRYPCGVLIYREHNSTMPEGNPINHYKNMMQRMPENAMLFAIVSANPFAAKIANIFIRMYRSMHSRVVFVNSLEEAQTVLAERLTSYMP